MACRTGAGKRKKKGDEPIQYVPEEEKKTVVESPAREEPERGKEGGKPERVFIIDEKGRLKGTRL